MKKIFLGIAAIIVLMAVLTAIHIFQNGASKPDGRTMEKILGMPADQAAPEDIGKLKKSDIMQLFYAADAPKFTEMKGEYKARLLPTGILFPVANFYAHHLMGPGHWEAKAFFPFESNKGWGYNLFSSKKGGNSKIVRTMKMDTHVGKSRFDDKDSFHLVYKAYNTGLNHTMRDEIRKINDRLYIGLGCLAWNMDTLNPCPFILYGTPDQWAGPDEMNP
jgi:hypothetical protein